MSTIIGSKIKQLRLMQHKKLKDLSNATGISIGYLSKIERENFTISQSMLEKIAQALNTPLDFFLEGPSVTRSFDRLIKYVSEDHLSIEQLSRNQHKRFMGAAILNVFPSSEDNPARPHTHNGEELVYVLEGVLTVLLNDKPYELYPGDYLQYSAEHTHRFENYTNKMVSFLSVVTCPANWDRYTENLAPLLGDESEFLLED